MQIVSQILTSSSDHFQHLTPFSHLPVDVCISQEVSGASQGKQY